MLFASGCASNPPSNATGGEGQGNITPVEGATVNETAAAENETIVGAAEKAGYTTFASVVKLGGLEATLNEGGPFTVFAPTNEAFNALPAGTLDNLSKDPVALKNVLTYHVVQGKYMAADLRNGQMLTTVQGAVLPVNITEGNEVMIGNATVTEADINASNGVIHGIDEVLIPPA
jgi:uncharacterized surface protein with fasciclin (FAS1) repeats